MSAPRAPDGEPVRFDVRRSGERITGAAPGFDAKRLRRLRRGEFPVDSTVDLHGLDRAGARAALREAFAEALAEGDRCVLVVHGRGLHSEGGAVLRDAFVAWLAEPPVGPRVLAFTSALPRDGGPGATYVLLRRSR